MDKARVKKSRPPKLPDLSAICNSPPFRPTVRMSGTPGAISGPRSERRNAEPIDCGARRLASCDDKPAHAEAHESERDLGERVFDRVARLVSAIARLRAPRPVPAPRSTRSRPGLILCGLSPSSAPDRSRQHPRSAFAWKGGAPETLSRPPRSVLVSPESTTPPGSQRSRPPPRAQSRAPSRRGREPARVQGRGLGPRRRRRTCSQQRRRRALRDRARRRRLQSPFHSLAHSARPARGRLPRFPVRQS